MNGTAGNAAIAASVPSHATRRSLPVKMRVPMAPPSRGGPQRQVYGPGRRSYETPPTLDTDAPHQRFSARVAVRGRRGRWPRLRVRLTVGTRQRGGGVALKNWSGGHLISGHRMTSAGRWCAGHGGWLQTGGFAKKCAFHGERGSTRGPALIVVTPGAGLDGLCTRRACADG